MGDRGWGSETVEVDWIVGRREVGPGAGDGGADFPIACVGDTHGNR